MVRPAFSSNQPKRAIIVPLSMQYILAGTWLEPSRSSAMMEAMSRRRWLHATPPPRRSSDFPAWAMARSATSMQAAKACSWRDQHTAPKWAPRSTIVLAAVKRPEKAMSIPRTA